METGIYDVIQRKPFEDLQEDYGFLYDNKYLDQLSVGDVIQQIPCIPNPIPMMIMEIIPME